MNFTIIRFENRVMRGCVLLAGSAAERLVASGSRASLRGHKLVMMHDFTAAYASIVQEDLFSDFFAYWSMAKDVDASEETFVASCRLPL
jgi:hypothetical protein